jgi:hypothetical protein
MGEQVDDYDDEEDEDLDDEEPIQNPEPVKRTKSATHTEVKEPPKKRAKVEKKIFNQENDITESEELGKQMDEKVVATPEMLQIPHADKAMTAEAPKHTNPFIIGSAGEPTLAPK